MTKSEDKKAQPVKHGMVHAGFSGFKRTKGTMKI